MRLLKRFEEFIEEGVVIRRTPDLSRVRSIVEESENRNRFLKEAYNKIGVDDGNANYFVEICYDILIGMSRAKMMSKGYVSSGEGAHEAEVSFMRELGFSEKEVRFMDELRYFRNGIKYRGKRFDKEYAKKVLVFLRKVYPKLFDKV